MTDIRDTYATPQQAHAASVRRGIGSVKAGLGAVRREADKCGDAELARRMTAAEMALDAVRARAAVLAEGGE